MLFKLLTYVLESKAYPQVQSNQGINTTHLRALEDEQQKQQSEEAQKRHKRELEKDEFVEAKRVGQPAHSGSV